jgi:hypothetical protein
MTQTREIPLRIGTDSAGTAVNADANNLVFYAAKAFPPGQPLQLTLWPDTPESLTIQARTIGSRLRENSNFEVRTRLINLNREARLKLQATFAD